MHQGRLKYLVWPVIGGVLLAASGCGSVFAGIDKDTVSYVKSLSKSATGNNILSEYRVGPEDVLDVRVWGDNGLSREVAVRPDGMITLPLIGDIEVAGKSSVEIGREVEKRLKEFKSAPKVDVSITQINSYRIYLLGEVQKPGMIQVRNFTTLLQAIALAGGPTHFASNDVLVLRKDKDADAERVLHLDYRLLSSNRAEDRIYNLILWPGDTVILK